MLFHFQWDEVAESKTLAVGFDRDYGQCQFWNLCLQRWVNFLLGYKHPRHEKPAPLGLTDPKLQSL